MAIFLRHSYNVKPPRWGSSVDVQYAIKINAEKIYDVDPNSIVLAMPLFWGLSLLDYSGKNNHGINYGATYKDGSLDFDGANNVGILNSASLNPKYITIFAWVKTSATGSYNQICTKDNTLGAVESYKRVWQFRKETNNKLNFLVFKTNADYDLITGATTISDGVLHHVVGTWDGSNIKAYVDGSSDATPVVYSGTLHQSQSNNVAVGKSENLDPSYWSGSIDEVYIANVAHSADQIALFHALPYGLYQPVSRPIYFFQAAEGISIPVAMQNMRGGFNPIGMRGGFINAD